MWQKLSIFVCSRTTFFESKVVQAQAGLSAAEISLQQVRDLSETRTKSQIEQAEAGLASLRANLEKIKRGAREEDHKQA